MKLLGRISLKTKNDDFYFIFFLVCDHGSSNVRMDTKLLKFFSQYFSRSFWNVFISNIFFFWKSWCGPTPVRIEFLCANISMYTFYHDEVAFIKTNFEMWFDSKRQYWWWFVTLCQVVCVTHVRSNDETHRDGRDWVGRKISVRNFSIRILCQWQ